MARRLIVVLSIACVSACGSTTTSPSSMSGGGLPFQAGRYAMELLGGSDPCGDIKAPQAGTDVSFFLTLSADATGWTGRTASGALVWHFQSSTNSGSLPFAVPLAGTASGFADDEAAAAPPGLGIQANGTRVTFASAIAFSGGIPSAFLPGFSTGTINGPVVFSRNGVTSTCPSGAVGWTMNRLN
jgi:hypothetical protein